MSYTAMATPKVSFVVPCYRLAHLLPACITSIRAQSREDFEVLIMDDCSPDETAAVATSFRDPRIRHVRNDHNLGHLANYNKGISLSRGEYIWLISADDRLRQPYLLERYVRAMDRNEKVGYACCPGIILEGDRETTVDGLVARRDTIFEGRTFLRRLLTGNFVIAASGMVRRTCYERFGAFPLDLPYAGDWFLWSLFALHYDVAYFAEPMVNYRAHELSMTNHLMTHRSTATLQEGFAVLWRIWKEANRIGEANAAAQCLARLADLYGRHLAGWTDRGQPYRMAEGEFEVSLAREGSHDGERALRSRVWVAAGDYSIRRLKFPDARRYYCHAADYDHSMGLRGRQLFLKTGTPGLMAVAVLRAVVRRIRSRRLRTA
jgi:glycosyltransferase involved in cell wall biosynthesis